MIAQQRQDLYELPEELWLEKLGSSFHPGHKQLHLDRSFLLLKHRTYHCILFMRSCEVCQPVHKSHFVAYSIAAFLFYFFPHFLFAAQSWPLLVFSSLTFLFGFVAAPAFSNFISPSYCFTHFIWLFGGFLPRFPSSFSIFLASIVPPFSSRPIIFPCTLILGVFFPVQVWLSLLAAQFLPFQALPILAAAIQLLAMPCAYSLLHVPSSLVPSASLFTFSAVRVLPQELFVYFLTWKQEPMPFDVRSQQFASVRALQLIFPCPQPTFFQVPEAPEPFSSPAIIRLLPFVFKVPSAVEPA